MRVTGRTVIDLTHPIEPSMPVSVGFPEVEMRRYLDQSLGDVATVEILTAGLHVGTHVDAPFHFDSDGSSIDQLDLLALCGSAVVVDVPEAEAWVPITATHFLAWERRMHDRIGLGDIVLVRSGHESRWWRPLPEGAEYMLRPWPHLTSSSIDFLLERGIKAYGVECPDPDKVDQSDLAANAFEGHHRLLGAGVLILENLANLASIPVPRFEFVAIPLKIRGASASPIRAFALLMPG